MTQNNAMKKRVRTYMEKHPELTYPQALRLYKENSEVRLQANELYWANQKAKES